VALERERAVEVVRALGGLSHIENRYQLVPVAWESLAPPVVGEAPQAVIDRYVMLAHEADIYVGILWQRLGTPFTDPASGQRFESGTEYEFKQAYRANAAVGRPRILLYRCLRETETSDAEERARVDAFFARFEGPRPALAGLYRSYRSVDEFEALLLQDLDALISALQAEVKPVRVSVTFSSSGSMLVFHLPEPATEILYRLEPDDQFRSTGTNPASVDWSTGQPMPEMTVPVPEFDRPLRIAVKYRDQYGADKGPFDIELDPTALRVQSVRGILRMIRWVECQVHDGRMLAYFTHLVSYKHGIERVEYSVDDESLSRGVSFRPWRFGLGVGQVEPDDELYVEIPLDAEYVAVRVTFRDGTCSEVRRFPVVAS
jgi:hypothetical protein